MLKKLLCFLPLLLSLLLSCTESELPDTTLRKPIYSDELQQGKNQELTIANAESWYVNQQAPVTRVGVTQDNSLGILVAPSWNHAKEWRKGKYEVVEASLRSNANIIYYNPDTYQQKDLLSKSDKAKLTNVGRTVILKDLETGKIITFTMVIVGSLDYLLHKDGLSNNNYLRREADFSGMVLYFDAEGNFVNGWRYVDGKITKSISPSLNDEDAASDSTTSAITRSETCYTTTIPYSYFYCPSATRSAWDDYNYGWEFGFAGGGGGGSGSGSGSGWDIDGGELGGPTITAPPCYWTTVEIPSVECYPTGDSGGGYAGGDMTPTPPSATTTSHPQVDKIIKSLSKTPTKDRKNLNADEIEKLENAITELVKKYCYGKALVNYLNDNGIMYDAVFMNPAVPQASSTVVGDQVYLDINEDYYIQPSTLLHEFIHLYQLSSKQITASNVRNVKGMLEYERALIDDIMYYAKHHGDTESDDEDRYGRDFLYGSPPTYNTSLPEYKEYDKIRSDYLSWIRKLTEHGVPSELSTDDFKKWIEMFSTYDLGYGAKGYDYTVDYAPTALNAILRLAQDCY
jgi:hypothetical protein